MLFYSEVTGQLFKTAEELEKAEAVELSKREEIKAQKKELEKLYKAYVAARDAYVQKKKEYDIDITEWCITL